jgi:hypothetical protein
MTVSLIRVGVLSLFVFSAARADDPPGKLLEDVANRTKVARQALHATVNDALSKAGKLPADAALLVLQDAQTQVSDASFLSTDEKKPLLDQINSKIKTLGRTKPDQASANPPPRQDRDQIEHQIHQELNAIRGLRQQGQNTEAQTRLKTLTEKFPNHPALLAGSALGNRQEVSKDQDRITKQRSTNLQGAMTDIDKSMGNVTNSVSYDPKVWAKASKREPVTLTRLSEREKQILKKLDETTKTDFVANQTPFEQLLRMLEKELGVPLVISKATMEDLRITYETQLTYSIPRDVSKRTLLKSVLGELGLTYVIKAETLQVMSILQAKNELRTGILDVRTLLSTGSNPNDIIQMIKSTVEPDSWDSAGGPGSITFQPPGTLIIKNSAEVIYGLGAKRR